MTAKAPCSLSVPNRCNSDSCLLHQRVSTTPPQIRMVLFQKQSKVQLCKESICPRFRTGGCCEMNLGLKEVSNSSWLTSSLRNFPQLNIPLDAWIYIAVRLQSFYLSTGVNLDHLPKRRAGSSFHFQAQKSKFHLWVLQITKLLYVKLCIRSFLQTGTNLGNRAVLVYKSFSVCGWVLIMTVLWHFKRQYVSRKAYGLIISNLHMWHICAQTEKKNANNHKSIFSFSQSHCYKLY